MTESASTNVNDMSAESIADRLDREAKKAFGSKGRSVTLRRIREEAGRSLGRVPAYLKERKLDEFAEVIYRKLEERGYEGTVVSPTQPDVLIHP